MYRAKARRGDGYVVFDEDMRAQDTKRLATETELRSGLERDELRLFYQPVVSQEDRRVIAVEALLRWEHPARGLLAPGEFLSVAEQSGLILPIGKWALEQACLEARRWSASDHEGPAPYVRVNLSSRQLAQPDLVKTVGEVLQRTGLPPSRLGLEVTEGVLMEEADSPVETLQALKQLGVRLLLDDFGTGYSSLSHLVSFPIDVLKIDRSFVARLGGDPRDEAILGAVLGMSRALGLTVIAEGVETEVQVGRLRALGCMFAQGYLFARPAPPEEMEGVVREGSDAAFAPLAAVAP
jgi:EAL domain-containing protein (putative c-di-GMP-specific phosphodiesterase class I)